MRAAYRPMEIDATFSQQPGQPRILVVDDTPANLKLLFSILNREGCRVFIAQDGYAALNHLEEHPVDLILLDVIMPGMDGIETCRRIKSLPAGKDIPIIFLTALSDPQSVVKGFEAGSVDYISKPFHPQEVLARINTQLTIQTLQTELRSQNIQLQREIEQHIKAKTALQNIRDELNDRVNEKTAELVKANARLKREAKEHQLTAKALRHSEQRFRQFISSISDHIYVSRITNGQSWNNLYISPNVVSLTGYEHDTFFDSMIFWLTEIVHPDDKNVFKRHTRALTRGISHEAEYRLIKADGSLIWIRDNARVEGSDDSLVVYGVISDITARKDLERKLNEIHLLGQELTLLHSEGAILKRVFKTVGQLISFDRSAYILVDDFTDELHFYNDTPQGWQCELKLPITHEKSIAVAAIRANETLLITDTDADTRYLGWSSGWIGRSELCAPICVGEKTIGALNIEAAQPFAFSRADRQLLETLAAQTGVALRNARLYAEAEHRNRVLQALNQAGRTMTSSLDLATVLERAMDVAVTMLFAEGVAVLLYDPVQESLTFEAAVSPGSKILLGQLVPIEGSIAGYSFARAESIIVNNVQRDPRFFKNVDDATGLSTQTILAVPISYRGNSIGVIEATNKLAGPFTQNDVELTEALASFAAIAIENARLFEEIHRSRQHARDLAQEVVRVQELERQRLAYELHDDTGQILTALKLWLEMTRDELPDQADPIHEKLDEAVKETGYLMDRIRAMARDLRPPALDVTGLNDALQDHCEDFARRTGLNIEYKGTAQNHLAEAAQICLYRVLQEALTNVAKHARAKHVQVSLKRDDIEQRVNLIVRDNGLGFDTQMLAAVGNNRPQGIGVSGMKERVEMLGGRFELKSKPGEGTLLTASLPAEGEKNDQGNSG